MNQKVRTGGNLALSGFQRATAQHAFRRLYHDQGSTRRFLVADETGLGKTHVAKEIISLAVSHLQQDDCVERIDVVYVCSNAEIAAQNIRKLNITESETPSFASRLSLLITKPELLTPRRRGNTKPATFVAFTPATSFQFGRQLGRGDERAVLYVLLRDHLRLRAAKATAAQRVFQGGVTSLCNFNRWYIAPVQHGPFEPGIRREFLRAFDESSDRVALESLIDEVVGRKCLTEEQKETARKIVGNLRQMLAQAAVHALEPDLVILDEFQRFKSLLDPRTGGDAAELAEHLFRHCDAHVLLLSATPYKPFTYSEETGPSESHYADFVGTLEFLADSDSSVAAVRSDLDALRRAALSDEPTAEIRDRVQSQLQKWIARTERPMGNRVRTSDAPTRDIRVRPEDFTDFAALRRVADAVSAPLSVEYWKSAPYFLNFLSGYRVGDKVRAAMKIPESRAGLVPLFKGAQRIDKSRVAQFKTLEWANARMRALADEALGSDWWRLLWMPPSLPYHSFGGPYEYIEPAAITKRLIFSSWVAAPSAIASLLSYEVQRRIFRGADHFVNTPEARNAISSRLAYSMSGGRPGSMSAIALFWPQPLLSSYTDPLDAAREHIELLSVERLLDWARERITRLVGPVGGTNSPASAVWHWFAPISIERGSQLSTALLNASRRELAEAMVGVAHNAAEHQELRGLNAHIEQMLSALKDWTPESERPTDLLETSALLGLGAPGNIAWRAIRRLREENDSVTDLGQWRAAAILASGLRSLFERPDVTLLLDSIYEGSSSVRPEDGAYWRKVARYCIDGCLQSVLDEYVHHLAGESGSDTTSDEGLITVASMARRAIALRGSVYRGTDIDDFDGRGIPFPSRYALRYGNTRYGQDESRLPEVRAAFNSPFWPFVLATTSIGQEGVDFHWWCHSVVHWNLPGNPVDFEQREGRIDRYKGHAIRKNVAAAHRSAALAPGVTDPWSAAFDAAAAESDQKLGGLVPYWMYPGEAQVQRRIMSFPLSRDEEQWARLQESLALYRLAFGQPRQEDMLAALERRGVVGRPERMDDLRIDLRPPVLDGTS